MSWLEDYDLLYGGYSLERKPICLPVEADLNAWVKYVEEGLRANQMPETTDIRFSEVTSGQQEKA